MGMLTGCWINIGAVNADTLQKAARECISTEQGNTINNDSVILNAMISDYGQHFREGRIEVQIPVEDRHGNIHTEKAFNKLMEKEMDCVVISLFEENLQ